MNVELVDLLLKKNYSIVCAESCTGGLISSKIVEIPNASKVFNGSYITYSNEFKEKLLDVNALTILKYDVVSEEVAFEMVKGACDKSNTKVGISTTGYCGPTGENIGRVCFGFIIEDKVFTETIEFGDIGRNAIREQSSNYAISKMYELLMEI